jgi:hypothetical protein
MNKHTIKKRQRANRFGFTINNPFITDDIKILTPDIMSDEQKQIYEKNKQDRFTHLKTPDNEKYFDFAVIEYNEYENGEIVGKKINERCFFKSYDLATEYFKTIEFIDYFCFQYEQGENGTKHLQGFMHFERPMDFNVVCRIFPTMHLQRCDGKNFENRDYCMKSETHIDGYDFVEDGILIEERQRTDISSFGQDVANNMSIDELFIKHPNLTLTHFNKIQALQQAIINQRYKNEVRRLHTTYIYGRADAGKTTYPQRVLGLQPMAVAKINDSNNNKIFDNYNGQDYILFDEFTGKIPITKLNDYLDGQPLWLPARYGDKVACYRNVFVISNYPLSEQYRTERLNGKQASYDGFLRRIHEIIYMPNRDHYVWQKGEPTQEVLDKLKEQNAIIEIKKGDN